MKRSAPKPAAKPPSDLRCQILRLDGREVLVLSHALEDDPDALVGLTRAQRDVVALVVEGMSNAEIAVARGTAVATIAKLLEGAYRRLGVHSRAELVASLPRRTTQ